MLEPEPWPPAKPLQRLPARGDGLRRAEGGIRLQAGPGRVRQEPPDVSYVTVVRNARATLQRTLHSVQAQRGAVVEHIVVDGASDDGTLALIQAHASQIDYFVSEPDQGLYDALNKAMTLARGRLVCVLNADDWLTRDAAAQAVRLLRGAGAGAAEPGPQLVLTGAWLHGGKGRRLWLPAALDAGGWLRCPHICHNGVYATRAALRATGPYDTSLRIVADTRWLLAAWQAGVPVTSCAVPTVHYVSGGLSSDTRAHVLECAQLLGRRFHALSDDEVWTLLHAFYPWPGNLVPFENRRPVDLGQALSLIAQLHATNADLQASLAAVGLARQVEHAHRLKARRPWREALQRGLTRMRYTVRSIWRD